MGGVCFLFMRNAKFNLAQLLQIALFLVPGLSPMFPVTCLMTLTHAVIVSFRTLSMVGTWPLVLVSLASTPTFRTRGSLEILSIFRTARGTCIRFCVWIGGRG